MAEKKFQGPGQWRSQAEAAQRPGNTFAELAEAARRLNDKGHHAAEAHVHQAARLLQGGYPDQAAQRLHKAAAALPPEAAGHAGGLREIAERIPTRDLAVPADEDPAGEPSLD
jgi:hypothetical protein